MDTDTVVKTGKPKYPSYSALLKPVARRTIEAHQGARRRLIVMFYPGDRIGFREEGRRRWYFSSLHRIYTTVVRQTAEAEAEERRKLRKQKGG